MRLRCFKLYRAVSRGPAIGLGQKDRVGSERLEGCHAYLYSYPGLEAITAFMVHVGELNSK